MDREKFCSRADLVRTLTHDEKKAKGQKDSLVSRQAVAELSFYTSSGDRRFLLPKIRSITWAAHSDQTVLQLITFASNAMERLELSLHSKEMHPSAPRVLSLLSKGLTADKMHHFELITSYDSDGGIQVTLGQYLERHQSLTSIKLTTFLVHPSLVHSLRRTSSLSDLRVNLSFGDTARVQSFIQSVSSACPALKVLWISTSVDRGTIPWSAMTALLDCHELYRLELTLDHALVVSPGDIETMGKAWPWMTTLVLAGSAAKGTRV